MNADEMARVIAMAIAPLSQELATLKNNLNIRMDRMGNRMDHIITTINQNASDLRTEFKSSMEELKVELETKIVYNHGKRRPMSPLWFPLDSFGTNHL